jgi:hypothetical protein
MKKYFKEQVGGKTDEELITIFTSPGDYQEEFVESVREELIVRNISITSYERQKEQNEKRRSEELPKGRPGDPTYIIIGFIIACFGGALGILAGYMFSQSKHKTAAGNYYVYDEPTRKKGILMLFIGILVFLCFLIYKFS